MIRETAASPDTSRACSQVWSRSTAKIMACSERRSLTAAVSGSATTQSQTDITRDATDHNTNIVHVTARRDPNRATPLTPRETEVMQWMAQGYTNPGIAKRLFVSTKTVEFHAARIFDKLDIDEQWGTNRRVLAVVRWLSQISDAPRP